MSSFLSGLFAFNASPIAFAPPSPISESEIEKKLKQFGKQHPSYVPEISRLVIAVLAFNASPRAFPPSAPILLSVTSNTMITL